MSDEDCRCQEIDDEANNEPDRYQQWVDAELNTPNETMTTTEIIETLRAHNEWRRGNDGRDEMLAPKLIGEAIDRAVEVLENGDKGWRNKWECAVEMAALATVERDEWSQRASRYGAERESNAMQALAYKAERDAALDALRKWDAVCMAADACNAEMESDECSQTQWEAFEKKHADLLESANRARLAVLFPENAIGEARADNATPPKEPTQ